MRETFRLHCTEGPIRKRPPNSGLFLLPKKFQRGVFCLDSTPFLWWGYAGGPICLIRSLIFYRLPLFLPHVGGMGLVVEQDEPFDPLNIHSIMLDLQGLAR